MPQYHQLDGAFPILVEEVVLLILAHRLIKVDALLFTDGNKLLDKSHLLRGEALQELRSEIVTAGLVVKVATIGNSIVVGTRLFLEVVRNDRLNVGLVGEVVSSLHRIIM